MSMPSYSLQCNRCDYSASDTMLWVKYVYRDDEGEFPCNKKMGWCDECNELATMEDFDDIWCELEDMKVSLELLKAQTQSFWQAFLNLLFRCHRNRHINYLTDIEASRKTIALSQSRKGSERCLKCGSHNIQPFDGKVNIHMDDYRVFTGEIKTDFTHPGCGGKLIAQGSEMRLSVRPRKKVYSPQGEPLEVIYE